MIKFNNVTFGYKGSKAKVLENFSLQIDKGDRVHISGASGKGKTTLLRLVMGLEKPKKGSITVEEGAKISVVFQENRLIPYVSVKENIALFSNEQKALALLRDLELIDYAYENVSALSGGMKRRVALARALSKDFDILLLDEAMNGLDDKTKEKVAAVINKYTVNKTLITVTHNSAEANLLNAKEILI